jgi:DNA-binding NtrC family response regulator
MQQIIRTLGRLCDSTVSVHLVGESGTGKELIARAIHQHSIGSAGPFVVVHCGTLVRESAHRELLGPDVTAANVGSEPVLGAFEAARGGTLFLDEIGELALDIQPLLLRALESDGYAPNKNAESQRKTVRVIAATQRNLLEAVQDGRFRKDLYHRLNVVQLELPPLRLRGEDVVLLARQFAAEFGIRDLSQEIVEQLRKYDWPGNVRELRNVLRGYAVVGILPCPQPNVSAEGFSHLLRSALDMAVPYQEQKERLVNQFIDVYLTELLRRAQGNQSEAARIAGLDRAHLNKMVSRLRRGESSAKRQLVPPHKPNL